MASVEKPKYGWGKVTPKSVGVIKGEAQNSINVYLGCYVL